jgi:hypothetical protein
MAATAIPETEFIAVFSDLGAAKLDRKLGQS